MKKTIAAVSSLVAFVSFAATPATWWASYPVKPGEHVLVSGGGWGAKPKVEIGGETVVPDMVSETGLVFKYPESVKDTIPNCRVVAENGEKSAAFTLNAPTVWFMQGDDLDRSTPGGEIRLFGRSLQVGNAALVSADGKEYPLEITFRDDWSLDTKVPEGVPYGTYAVRANGIPVGTWTIAAKRDFSGGRVFDVTGFGAKADDGMDDQTAIEAAFKAAEKANGGIVRFPRGRFDVHGTLRVPTNTVLKGLSRDASGIYWPDFYNPPRGLIELATGTGVEDLFLSSGLFAGGFVTARAPGYVPPLATDISLKRLTVRFVTNFWRDDRMAHDFLRRYNTSGNPIDLRNVERVVIEDVDIFTDKNNVYNRQLQLTGTQIRVVRSSFRGTGWAAINIKQGVVEQNEFSGICISVLPSTREMFWSRNRHGDRYSGDRECITHDLRNNAYCGDLLPGTVEGTRVSLNVPPETKYVFPGWIGAPWGKMEQWEGKQMEIISGKGKGQSRDIVKVHARDVYEIDRPYDIAPDETSLFSVGESRWHIIYVDNVIRDSKHAISLYGGAHDSVVARNDAKRAGAIEAVGVSGPKGVAVVWDVQFVGNRLVGNMRSAHKGLRPETVGSNGKVADKYFDNHSLLVRGNELDQASVGLGAFDMLAEGNTVRHARVGIVDFGYEKTHFIGDNRFEDVGKELGVSADIVSLNLGQRDHSTTPWSVAAVDSDVPPEQGAKLDWRRGESGSGGYVFLDHCGLSFENKSVFAKCEFDVPEEKEATVVMEAPQGGIWGFSDDKVVRDPEADTRPSPAFVLKPGRHSFAVFVPRLNGRTIERIEVRLYILSEPDTVAFVAAEKEKSGVANPKAETN